MAEGKVGVNVERWREVSFTLRMIYVTYVTVNSGNPLLQECYTSHMVVLNIQILQSGKPDLNCSVFKIFCLVISFFALCLLHLYAHYICNTLFPCSTVLDMSCYTISRWGPEDAKNGVGVRKV